ncbi:MAG: hypothetical protein ACOCT0_02310 [Halobacteriota archaeon]
MNVPAPEQIRTHESSFDVAHTEARQKGFTGSLVVESDRGKGVVVYLEGWPVYAEVEGLDSGEGEEAVDVLVGVEGEIERHTSRTDSVEMFLTYMSYIGRESGLIDVFETDHVEVDRRTILVTQAGNLNKTKAPAGTRIGYASDLESAERYFESEETMGYALSNDEIVFFDGGEEVEREHFKEDGLSMLVRMKTEEGLGALECEYLEIYTQGASSSGGQIDVEFDIEGWEIVETEGGSDGDSGGFLGGILGG